MQTPEFKAIVFPFSPLLFLLVRINSVCNSNQTNKQNIYKKILNDPPQYESHAHTQKKKEKN